jgi:hypothetical protein
MARRTDLVPVELFDPVTGRSVIVYQRELPLTEQGSRAVMVPPQTREVVVVRPRSRAMTVSRKRTPRPTHRPRTKRARTAALCFLVFILSWIPAGFDCPGGTLLVWGILFSYILYTLVK